MSLASKTRQVAITSWALNSLTCLSPKTEKVTSAWIPSLDMVASAAASRFHFSRGFNDLARESVGICLPVKEMKQS